MRAVVEIDDHRRRVAEEHSRLAAELSAATEAAIVRSLPRWVAKALRARGLAWIGMAYVRRNTSMTSQWLPGESVMLITVLHKGVPTARFRVTPVGRFTEIPVDG